MNPLFIYLVIFLAIVVLCVALTKPARESVPVLLGLGGVAGLCLVASQYASIIGGSLVVWFFSKMLTRPHDEADSMLKASLTHYADPSISEIDAYNFYEL